MALYILHSIFHLARLLYVRPETFRPYCVFRVTEVLPYNLLLMCKAELHDTLNAGSLKYGLHVMFI